LPEALYGSPIYRNGVIGEFCPYCLAAHITGLLLVTLIIWRAAREFGKRSNDFSQTNSTLVQNISPINPQCIIRPLPTIWLTLIGMVIATCFAALQVGFTPSTVNRDGESQNNLPIINYNTLPMVGSAIAPLCCHLTL
jgi:hypothetical protein